MANMDYCRFENTYSDLKDCYENWEELEEDDETELKYRDKILKLCKEIVDDFAELEDEDED